VLAGCALGIAWVALAAAARLAMPGRRFAMAGARRPAEPERAAPQ
jgi:hypothetical protein